MSFYLNAENGAGVQQGEGPLESALHAKVTSRLSAIGAVEAAVPATDPKLQYFLPTLSYKPVLRVLGMRDDGLVHDLGSGPIQKVETQAGTTKQSTISGPDQLTELTRLDVGALSLDDGASGPMVATSILSAILALAPSGWTSTGTPSQAVYYQYSGESIFVALTTLKTITGDEFRLSKTVARQIEWLPKTTGFVDSGVRVIAEAPNQHQLRLNDDICLVKDNLGYTVDFSDTITRIKPTGAGNGAKRLNLAHCTVTPPAGYMLDTVNNILAYTPSEPTGPDIVCANISFKDITNKVAGTVAAQSAANTLYSAGKVYLDQHLVPIETYKLTIVKLTKPLLTGQTLFIDYQGIANGYLWINVQKTLLVTEIVELTDNTGTRTVEVTASTVNVPQTNANGVLVSTISKVRAIDAHSQPVEQASGLDVLASANTVYAGPSTGPAATATFRALADADLPTDATSYGLVRNNGVDLTRRPALNLVGGGFLTVDDSGNAETELHLNDPALYAYMRDDFASRGAITSGVLGELGWSFGGFASFAATAAAAFRPGMVRGTTVATTGTLGYMHLRETPATGIILFADSFDITWIARFAPTGVVTNYDFRCGLAANASSANGGTTGESIEFLAGDTNWFYVARTGSTDTRTDLGVAKPTATSFLRIRMRKIDSTHVGVTFGTLPETSVAVASIPASACQPYLQVVPQENAPKTLDIDYFSLTVTGLSR